MMRIIGHKPHGPPLDPHQTGDNAKAKILAQFEHRACIGQGLDHITDQIGAQAVFWNGLAQ